jgi:SAM-dependent methyltransferase
VATVLAAVMAIGLIGWLAGGLVLVAGAALLGWMGRTRQRAVVFDPCSPETARRMLEAARLRAGEVIYDLGCGDGRVLIMAARRGARGLGIEVDPILVLVARLRARVSRVHRYVRIVRGDLHDADVSQADVVFQYLNSDANARLAPRLARQLRPTARVVSLIHPMPGWTAAGALPAGMPGSLIYVYDSASWAGDLAARASA